MPRLFGESLTRRELEARIGALRQVGGIQPLTFKDGPEASGTILQVETGTGFAFHVLPDRGLDISAAKYCGASLSWDSPCGEVHPAHYDPAGLGWLKSFPGGLVCTCGMTTCGAPCNDAGEELGLHGRFSHLAARNLQVSEEWNGDRCMLRIEGDIRETVVFGANLVCHRKITTEIGSNTFRIQDTVTNEGFENVPLMLLYHINLGYPVVSSESRLISAAEKVTPRDAEAEKEAEEFSRFDPPTPGYKERVYFHDLREGADGYATAAIVNESFCGGRGIGVEVRYRQAELPRFIQWKNMGTTTYVCGLEPANCLVMGRAEEKKRGTLETMEPGQSKEFDLQITALTGAADILETEKRISGTE